MLDFKQEVQVCCSLRHPHLVEFLGFTTKDERSSNLRLAIVLELLAGGALDTLLYKREWRPTTKQCGALGIACLCAFVSVCLLESDLRVAFRTLKMALDVCDAMGYLHGQTSDTDPITGANDSPPYANPLIHRDLKSPNLLLTASPFTINTGDGTPEADPDFVPHVKITDFGLSRHKQQEESSAKHRQTVIMTGCGTLYWMAPEVIKGERYNESIDVYSFAMVLIEMASGVVPWKHRPDCLGDGCKGCLAQQEVPYLVAKEEKRPPLPRRLLQASPNTPDSFLRSLIEECWRQDASQRPCFPGLWERVAAEQAKHWGVPGGAEALVAVLESTTKPQLNDPWAEDDSDDG